MGVEDFKKFVEACGKDENLREKVKKVGISNFEGIVEIGKEAGFNFTVDDIKAAAEEVSKGRKDELGEEELEKVAGGISDKDFWSWMAAFMIASPQDVDW